ncbi:MAG: NAD(P)-dependent oxidoreductase [Pseudomonadota bacterium]
MGGLTILVTGGAGFLGGATVDVAEAAGHRVVSLVRSPLDDTPNVLACDLADPAAASTLAELLMNVDAVIHTAAAMQGGDEAHQRDTVTATATLLEALAEVPTRKRPRLIHVSSLAVYGYASLPEGALLDELAPTEPDPGLRDAYCRAKLAQEALVADAVRAHGMVARVLRPGVIHGPGRQWTARLGMKIGGVALCLAADAPLPLIHVNSAARALVRAAETPLGRSDLENEGCAGHLEVINLVGGAQPRQAVYLRALKAAGVVRHVFPLPRRLVKLPARLAGLTGLVFPGLPARLPGLLRTETLDARFKPLRYSTARLKDRLSPLASSPATPPIPRECTVDA